jgi:uncharacterized OB-fold protein
VQQPGHHPQEGACMSAVAPGTLVEGSRCGSCGHYFIPQRQLCPRCRGTMQKATVEGKGKILSWTIVHVTPVGVPSPRTVALVGLDCGASVLCLVADSRKLDIGQVVEVRFVDDIHMIK